MEPRQHSQYSDWAASWMTEESWFISWHGKDFLFKSYRPALGPSQPSQKWETGARTLE